MTQQSVTLNVSVRRTDEDSKLIDESLSGSRDAFRELFNKHVSKVHSICMRLSADPETADDLTQEVFITAWEKLRSFRFESKFSSWLHRIAVNRFLMHVRSEKSRDEAESETNGSLQGASSAKSTEIRMDLERALSTLPLQARTVLILHDIEGYKHHEISELMGIETGTSKAHLHRARKMLREELSK